MKLVCISDTHNKHRALDGELPDGDLLIHAGDLTSLGRQHETEDAVNWLVKHSKRFTHGVVFIAGNHDKCFDPKYGETKYFEENGDIQTYQQKPEWLIQILSDLKSSNTGVHYLENSSVIIEGVTIWGSPYSPWFHGDRWAFNKHRGKEIRDVWRSMPASTDIVVTHTPVQYKLDYVPTSNEYVGCYDLDIILGTVKPLLHVCGHIHEGYGKDQNIQTTFINASICDEFYNPTNRPWVVEIIDKEIKSINNG